MSRAPASATASTPAERVRSVLAVTVSATVRMIGYRAVTYGPLAMDRGGSILLDVPDDAHLALAVQVAAGPSGCGASIECADVAPVAVRERVRATVTVSGRVAQPHRMAVEKSGSTLVRLEPERAVLDEDGVSYSVPIGDLADAMPDPIAAMEADFLTHLVDAHPDMVDVLANQIDPTLLHGACRVVPLRADRHGVVLRIERARDHVDVRLGFPAPVASALEFADAFGRLLHRPRRCRRQRGPARRA